VKYVQVGLGSGTQVPKRVLSALGFECAGIVLRNWRAAGVPVYTDLGEALWSQRPDFVLALSPAFVAPATLDTVIAQRTPVVATTDLVRGHPDRWRAAATTDLVQVLELHPFMPGHLARLEVVRQGLIGEVNSVQLSVHAADQVDQAMALMRAYLQVRLGVAQVHIHRFGAPDGPAFPGVTGKPAYNSVAEAGSSGAGTPLMMAGVDFGEGRTGICDLHYDRPGPDRLLVRGTRGEISGDQVVRVGPGGSIVTTYLQRHLLDDGHVGEITLGDTAVWTNPWPDAGWTDQELAVARVARRLTAWLGGLGPAPYPLAEAIFDARLSLAVTTAAQQDRTVEVRG